MNLTFPVDVNVIYDTVCTVDFCLLITYLFVHSFPIYIRIVTLSIHTRYIITEYARIKRACSGIREIMILFKIHLTKS